MSIEELDLFLECQMARESEKQGKAKAEGNLAADISANAKWNAFATVACFIRDGRHPLKPETEETAK